MSFDTLTSTATVAVLFKADQAVARGPFLPEIGAPFAESFKFGSLELVANVPGSRVGAWQAESGQFKDGERFRLIEHCRGSVTDLSVSVADVDSRTAEKVLQEIWGTLGRLARQHLNTPTPLPLDKIGTLVFESSAIVQASQSFADLFPVAKMMRDEVIKNVDNLKPWEESMFRLAIDTPLVLGRRIVSRQVILEPRYYAQDKDRVFFTRSPLTSEEHTKLLQKLFR